MCLLLGRRLHQFHTKINQTKKLRFDIFAGNLFHFKIHDLYRNNVLIVLFWDVIIFLSK